MLVVAVAVLSAVSAVLGDPDQHFTLGALGSVQFVLNTNAAALTSAMAVLIALVLLTVQLTAQRYSFSVLGIFVQDRVNAVLISLFIVTIVFNLWLGADPQGVVHPGFATLLAMILMTLCFAMLPPYVLYLFDIIRPDNILDHIQGQFVKSVRPATGERPDRAAPGAGHPPDRADGRHRPDRRQPLGWRRRPAQRLGAVLEHLAATSKRSAGSRPSLVRGRGAPLPRSP